MNGMARRHRVRGLGQATLRVPVFALDAEPPQLGVVEPLAVGQLRRVVVSVGHQLFRADIFVGCVGRFTHGLPDGLFGNGCRAKSARRMRPSSATSSR